MIDRPAARQPSQRAGSRSSLALKLGATTIVSLLLVILALRHVDFGALSRFLANANYLYIAAAAAMYFVDLAFRSVRWQVLLRSSAPVSWRRLYPVLAIGYMANNLLPARIGELSRVYLVRRREQISASTVLASVAIERVVDGVTVLTLLVLTLPVLPETTWLGPLTRIAGATFGVGLLVCLVLAAARPSWLKIVEPVVKALPSGLAERFISVIDRFVEGFAVLRRPRQLAWTAALSVVIWGVGASIYVLVATAFGVQLSPVGALAAICIVNLATAVPLAPAGLGAFEVAALAVFALLGMPDTTAVGVTIVLHAVLFLPVVAVGLAFLWRMNLSLGALWTDARQPLPVAGLERVG